MTTYMPMAYLQTWAEGADVNRAAAGQPLEHTASNVFRKRGVRPGDTVFVAEVADGHLELVGRLVVQDMLTKAQAQASLPYDVWDAADHLIAAAGASPVTYGRRIRRSVAAQLTFLQKTGRMLADGSPRYRLTSLTFDDHGRLDAQTTRTVRRLTYKSAACLEKLLR
jgi:hypothetical protein